MSKQNDAVNIPGYPDNRPMLNMAEGLVTLLRTNTSELCTPGHRRGRGFQLLVAGLVADHNTRQTKTRTKAA